MYGKYSRAVYNQERFIMVCLWYILKLRQFLSSYESVVWAWHGILIAISGLHPIQHHCTTLGFQAVYRHI